MASCMAVESETAVTEAPRLADKVRIERYSSIEQVPVSIWERRRPSTSGFILLRTRILAWADSRLTKVSTTAFS